MKKSRIIIPALAMIAFSMAASITGAVAWFTATRTASISAGTYAVVKTSANLSVTATAGYATTATNSEDGTTHTVTVGGVLTDGSFNHSSGNVITPDDSGSKIKSVTAHGSMDDSNMLRGVTGGSSSQNIYTAVSFNLSFTVTFSSNSGDIGLYLDRNYENSNINSRFTVDGGAAASSATGFRMAFLPTGTNSSSGETRVFAGLQASSNCKYVSGSTVNAALDNSGTYGTNVLIDSSHAGTSESPEVLPDSFDTRANATGRCDYFGVFAAPSTPGAVTLEYKVVCWFEGTDPNVVNTATLQSVIATLSFKALNIPDAA